MPAIKKPSTGENPTMAVPSMGVFGDFVDNVDVISSSSMSLMACPAKLKGGTKIVAPFVSFCFKGPAPGEEPEQEVQLFSKIITLDNAAFAVNDILIELSATLQHLVDISGGALKPERVRLENMERYLQRAQSAIGQSLDLLETLNGLSVTEAVTPRKAVPSKKVAPLKPKATARKKS